MERADLLCPVCRGVLDTRAEELRCTGCGRTYETTGGIPQLMAGPAGQAAEQARFFDEAVDDEYEITRPHGTPAFYAWLLREKFRRSVAGVELGGATAVAVCAGSGMDAEFLARAGARVTAVDVSPGAAARTAERALRQGLAIRPVVADAARLPFADRSFDVAYVHDGLHHLERPADGLREMARVARHAVCVSEPARAAVTRLAVGAGLALEREEAGNRVARLGASEVREVLESEGFRIERAERYGMLYRHEPGAVSRALSRPRVLPFAVGGLRLANALAGRFGNKLAVVAVRR